MDESKFRRLLKEELSISYSESARLIARAPHAYKKYRIKKADGGFREISQPAKETKFVMHWVIDRFLKPLPVHESAAAYRKGASVKKNAAMHSSNSYLAKFDFKNFFPSIKISDIERHLALHGDRGLDERSVSEIARLCTIAHMEGKCLSIGSPASPFLSNSIMYDFDEKVSRWCAENALTYTRYADDLTFSTNVKNLSFEVQGFLIEVIQSLEYPAIELNENKTVYASKKGHRRVTGVVLSNAGNVSLGRERKREISSLLHKFRIGELSREEVYRLQGLLGFANDVEPVFVERMRKKYGHDLLWRIMSLSRE
ncbi:retron St85 family RNA-directed DNA polymerase [Halomonas halmophila]|uniref:RNA-directed DNA polymerase n=1 Tax=Halomonas halmophila TaxID=252 RepID=A0A4Y4F6Y9_9GAMM|nr:retron St85 family RNA-directed DNA polymerase [Halomonas halmophila]GED23614.1 RNA-directed DNA polymerase [Halomonas halmophila]